MFNITSVNLNRIPIHQPLQRSDLISHPSLNLHKTSLQPHWSMLIITTNIPCQYFPSESLYCPFSHPIPADKSPDSPVLTPIRLLRRPVMKKPRCSGSYIYVEALPAPSIREYQYSNTGIFKSTERPFTFSMRTATRLCLISPCPITIYYCYLYNQGYRLGLIDYHAWNCLH